MTFTCPHRNAAMSAANASMPCTVKLPHNLIRPRTNRNRATPMSISSAQRPPRTERRGSVATRLNDSKTSCNLPLKIPALPPQVIGRGDCPQSQLLKSAPKERRQ